MLTSEGLKQLILSVSVYCVGDTEFVLKAAYERIEELECAVSAANDTIERLKRDTNQLPNSSIMGRARHR